MAKILIEPIKARTVGLEDVTIDGFVPQKGATPKLAGTLHSSDRGESKIEWDIEGKCLGCLMMSEDDNLSIVGPVINLVHAAMIMADDTPPPPGPDGDVQEMQAAPAA